MLRPFMEVNSPCSGPWIVPFRRVDRPMERNVLTAIENCKEAEHLLEERFGVAGRGLHEKITSVEDLLPPRLTRILRKIATIRNKAVHERGSESDVDWEQFKRDSLGLPGDQAASCSCTCKARPGCSAAEPTAQPQLGYPRVLGYLRLHTPCDNWPGLSVRTRGTERCSPSAWRPVLALNATAASRSASQTPVASSSSAGPLLMTT